MPVSPNAAPTGAYHPDLMVAGFHRYRAPRIAVSELTEPLTCMLRVNGETVGPCAVINVSATGVAVESLRPVDAGTALEEVQLCYGDRVVFSALATVAHRANIEGQGSVLGLRFAHARFDAHALRRQDGWTAEIRQRVALLDQQTDRLPVAWRAAVADLRRFLDEAERMLHHDDGKPEIFDPQEETALLATAFLIWGPRLHALIAKLHGLSKELSEEAREAGRAYAHRLLWPALQTCPMHRRAHDKPQGYAGDYRMMLLYFATQYEGPTRYARFLHYASQRYTLGRAVVLRQECLLAAIRGATQPGSRPRIVSLASGPALELASAIERGELTGPLDLVLVDQDEQALGYAHSQLSQLLHERDLDIHLLCLHMSVKQLLSSKPEAERLRRELANADLIYCAGLYDYLPDLVAERLTSVLYGLLKPNGRLYLGNLSEAPDTSWMMDYVLAWQLIYRTSDDMLRIGASLTPEPAELAVETDASGHAIFLSVRAPAG
jgi:extracellular factor (EF) 3-hydroxypalmitic acid methyl ester biosynthesis protein